MKKVVLIFALVSMVLSSCGSDKKAKTDVKTEAKTEVKKEEVKTAPASTNLEIAGDDAMKFDKSELRVKAGQKVNLTLTHSGKMKKEVMGHNFVLLAKGTDIAAFAEKAMEAKDSGYVPAGDSSVLAHTGVVGGGESITITFTAPEAGTYDFICSFPGHYSMMKGKFIVE